MSYERIRSDIRSLVRDLGVMQARYPELGLGVTQCHTLLELAERPLSLGELASLLKVDLSTASRNLDTLERHGLIVSSRAKNDSRMKFHRLSRQGRRKISSINRRGDRVVERAFEFLSPRERTDVQRGLALFSKALTRSEQRSEIEIRPSTHSDNAEIAGVIRHVLKELGQDKPGTAYFEPQTDRIHQVYQEAQGVYFVLTKEGRVYGGGGIFPLRKTVCELKNMYFLPQVRGGGQGKRLMNILLAYAEASGFEEIVLETYSGWKSAIDLYERFGFVRSERPRYYKGHALCDLFFRGIKEREYGGTYDTEESCQQGLARIPVCMK